MAGISQHWSETCEHTDRRWTKYYPGSTVDSDGAIRRGTIVGFHVWEQCTRCGAHLTTAKKADVQHPEQLPEFDLPLRGRIQAERMAGQYTVPPELTESYQDYIQSDRWRAIRLLVIGRCKGICEGCAAAGVDHVHHLTYRHFKREFLFELVGLCRACHERVHRGERG